MKPVWLRMSRIFDDQFLALFLRSISHAGYADTLITDGTSIPDNNKSHARELSSSAFLHLCSVHLVFRHVTLFGRLMV